MLSSIRIQKFKSYRDATLHLAPLTVLIGANASGKSNAIEALLEILVGAGGVNLPEEGKKQQNHQRRDGNGHHVHHEVDPVCGKGFGGNGDERNGSPPGAWR